jgi:hypothetical protein
MLIVKKMLLQVKPNRQLSLQLNLLQDQRVNRLANQQLNRPANQQPDQHQLPPENLLEQVQALDVKGAEEGK